MLDSSTLDYLLSHPLLLVTASFVAGLVISLLFFGVLYRTKRRQTEAASSEIASTRQSLERLQGEFHRLSATEESLRAQLATVTEDLATARSDYSAASQENAALKSRLESERLRFQEQLALVQEARQTLTREFENLANRIFDEKQQTFTASSKQSLESTVNPLREELTAFRKKVEDAYDKENAERNRLAGQVIELQKQAQRVSDEAVTLARALKGESKLQGNWGEMVLERILEESGLTKGREYETQVSLKNDEGQRRNPDVIVHLPEGRDIVIDAKVSLTDYERYCREEDADQRQQYLRQHINSIRAHINGLNRKAYEQLEGVRTLDFVLIFVPVEAAFMLALELDNTLFRDAYDKGIILVSPTTLLATLRTIHNIWRYEAQNRNAELIADKAGKLYDQLCLVVESLEDVGKHLDRSRQSWDTTRKRLVDGRGNLVKQVQDLREMGAKARRNLPESLVEEARDNDEARDAETSHQEQLDKPAARLKAVPKSDGESDG